MARRTRSTTSWFAAPRPWMVTTVLWSSGEPSYRDRCRIRAAGHHTRRALTEARAKSYRYPVPALPLLTVHATAVAWTEAAPAGARSLLARIDHGSGV